jgi:hypothetical protein
MNSWMSRPFVLVLPKLQQTYVLQRLCYISHISLWIQYAKSYFVTEYLNILEGIVGCQDNYKLHHFTVFQSLITLRYVDMSLTP